MCIYYRLHTISVKILLLHSVYWVCSDDAIFYSTLPVLATKGVMESIYIYIYKYMETQTVILQYRSHMNRTIYLSQFFND